MSVHLAHFLKNLCKNYPAHALSFFTTQNKIIRTIRTTTFKIHQDKARQYVLYHVNHVRTCHSHNSLFTRIMDKLFTELNFLLGRPEAAFDYPLQGWSYYNRATNLLREPARAEVGWGQWTKPGSDDNDQFNEVCALNPLGFLECDDNDNSSETNNNDPNCMGDYLQRESCDVWVCGDEDKGGIRGSIEGGMGYWPG